MNVVVFPLVVAFEAVDVFELHVCGDCCGFGNDLSEHALVESICSHRVVVDESFQQWCCPDAAALISALDVAVAGGVDRVFQ